ncbi:ribosomal RNA processing protein [Panus rudis PR-1116 ss-1]|nr:ribosomal RNA processing protein [Panus rudis PR-1116 ss-1]
MASAASSSSSVPPLGKYLASTDKKTRDKAIKSLAAFLSDPSRDDLPKLEMAKLWKGIFYCFWMSDKPLVQQALATEIAEILLMIPSINASIGFLRGFWEAIVREWGGIDRLRIDKYYMLVRRFVNASFRLLMRTGWEENVCQEYNRILTDRGGPLCPDDMRVPTSLSYHLADIYLEELDKALANPPSSAPLPAPFNMLVSPFFMLAARTSNNTTYQRIQSALLDPLFDALSSDAESHGKRSRTLAPTLEHVVENSCSVNPKTEGALERGELKRVLLKRLFDIASEENTRDANRRKMYAFWRKTVENEDGDHADVDAS